MSTPTKIAERLLKTPEASAIALEINTENYFDAIQGVLDNFAIKKELDSIYVASSIPSKTIIDALVALEIDLAKIYFVDCISYVVLGVTTRTKNTFYVESPTMLENIMLWIEYLTRKTRGGNVVVLDSINSLAIHNNTKILSEFLHILVSNLRAKGSHTIIFSMREYGSQEIRDMTNFICDEVIPISSEETEIER